MGLIYLHQGCSFTPLSPSTHSLSAYLSMDPSMPVSCLPAPPAFCSHFAAPIKRLRVAGKESTNTPSEKVCCRTNHTFDLAPFQGLYSFFFMLHGWPLPMIPGDRSVLLLGPHGPQDMGVGYSRLSLVSTQPILRFDNSTARHSSHSNQPLSSPAQAADWSRIPPLPSHTSTLSPFPPGERHFRPTNLPYRGCSGLTLLMSHAINNQINKTNVPHPMIHESGRYARIHTADYRLRICAHMRFTLLPDPDFREEAADAPSEVAIPAAAAAEAIEEALTMLSLSESIWATAFSVATVPAEAAIAVALPTLSFS